MPFPCDGKVPVAFTSGGKWQDELVSSVCVGEGVEKGRRESCLRLAGDRVAIQLLHTIAPHTHAEGQQFTTGCAGDLQANRRRITNMKTLLFYVSTIGAKNRN